MIKLGTALRLVRRALGTDRLPVLSPREGYDRWAPEYHDNMNPVQVLESEAIARLLPELGGLVVLDLGCGKGRLSRLAAARGAAKVFGIDISTNMLKGAAEVMSDGEIELCHADAADLPFETSSFDAVLSGLMLGHASDFERVLREVARVLRPGGSLLISDFHPEATNRGCQRAFRDSTAGRSFAIESHPHSIDDYARSLDELGFDIEALEEKVHDGSPIVFVIRARKR